MTATLLPVQCSGGLVTIHPISKPLSIMAHTMLLMPTGASLMPTQSPSHGAGQTRLANSGELLVKSKRLSASLHWSLNTKSFHLAMTFEMGQPSGTPQPMHRAAWYLVILGPMSYNATMDGSFNACPFFPNNLNRFLVTDTSTDDGQREC